MHHKTPWKRRSALLHMPPDAPVRLWTFQHPAALDAARTRGWLTGDHGLAPDGDGGDNGADPGTGFRRAYAWMRERMAERVPGFSGNLPVWAWVARPCAEHIAAVTDPTILLEAKVPRRRVVLSDFDLFHSVLNGWPACLTEAEYEASGDGVAPGETHPSWEHIFDLAPREGDAALWCGQPDVVQACVDRIALDEIVAVRTVRGRATDVDSFRAIGPAEADERGHR